MSWACQLVDEVEHVVFAVNVADFAVRMVRIFDLVFLHLHLVVEVPEAILEGAFDLPHLEGECELDVKKWTARDNARLKRVGLARRKAKTERYIRADVGKRACTKGRKDIEEDKEVVRLSLIEPSERECMNLES